MYAIRHRSGQWVIGLEPILTYSPDWLNALRFATREAAEAAIPAELLCGHRVATVPAQGGKVYLPATRRL